MLRRGPAAITQFVHEMHTILVLNSPYNPSNPNNSLTNNHGGPGDVNNLNPNHGSTERESERGERGASNHNPNHSNMAWIDMESAFHALSAVTSGVLNVIKSQASVNNNPNNLSDSSYHTNSPGILVRHMREIVTCLSYLPPIAPLQCAGAILLGVLGSSNNPESPYYPDNTYYPNNPNNPTAVHR